MKIAFQLAYKNLMGAGLRTWLNAIVLSLVFIIILMYNGILDGWNQQARRDTIAWEYGQGQVWHEAYDPLDAFSIQDSHAEIPATLQNENFTPVLLRQASIYPEGRLMPVLLKGIKITQKALALPVEKLANTTVKIPALIGKRMSESSGLKEGDEVLLRWRDAQGRFDAQQITIVAVFDTHVPTVDGGQIWLPLERLQELTGLKNQATFFVQNQAEKIEVKGWVAKSQAELLHDLDEIIQSKQVGSAVMYLLLLAIALLAIFDTQVLSIFRRQKEIGTYIALGMTRRQVMLIFTLEGTLYSVFAVFLGTLYGFPLLYLLAEYGFSLPEMSQDMGLAVTERIYPVYTLKLVVNTLLLLVCSATFVSFLPARKIAKMNPVNAIKGKLQ